MPEKSEIVEAFERIKSDANCDDVAAAILTLAQSVGWINVNLQLSENGYPERLGERIADAIGSLRKEPLKVTMESASSSRPTTRSGPKKKTPPRKRRR